MSTKNISISLILTAALGLSGCGGGGDKTPTVEVDGNTSDPVVVTDTTAPQFTNSDAINTYPTLVEGSTNLEIATIEAEDPSGVTFALGGPDAEYFELVETKSRAAFSTVLKFKDIPDYEIQAQYRVSVQLSDSEGNTAIKDFVVTLEDKPFVFDVASNMGSTIERTIGTLALTTKEAKGDVTYEMIENDLFTRNSNVIIFNAPEFNATEGANNSYTSIITANDTDSDIMLTVTASVMDDGVNPIPVVKTYLLKSKREIEGTAFTDFIYTYDDNKTLIKVERSGTEIYGTDFTTYRYSDDHKIMRGYNESETLESIRVFEDKLTDKNKFAATIVNSRLSIGEYVNYLREISDTVSYRNNRHLVKHIYGLDVSQTKAELYVYNADDTLSRELTGNYTISSDYITALSDTELHTLNTPAGGFPSADTRLSDTQLSSLNSGTMPYELSQETTYLYSNDILVGRKGIGYGYVSEENLDVNVSYYSNDVIKKIESEGVSIEYDTESLLKKVNDYNYNYDYNNQSVTVTITNDGQTVATYYFEEE